VSKKLKKVNEYHQKAEKSQRCLLNKADFEMIPDC